MINSDIIIKVKGCSEKQRSEVKDILFSNYLELLDAIEKEADYCSFDAYWKNYTPTSGQIINADEFITEYKKEPKPKECNNCKHKTYQSSILCQECLCGCKYEFFESK